MFSMMAAIVALPVSTSLLASNYLVVSNYLEPASATLSLESTEHSFFIAQKLTQIAQIDSSSVNLDLSENSVTHEISRLLSIAAEQSVSQEFTAAADSYRQALELIERLELVDPLIQAEALWGLGRAYADLEADDAALPVLEAALTLYDGLAEQGQTPDLEAVVPSNEATPELAYADIRIDLYRLLGAIQHERANYATALGYYRPGLVLAEGLNRKFEQVKFQYNIGLVAAEIGQYEQAEEALNQSIALSNQVEPTEQVELAERLELSASAIVTLAGVCERQKNYEEAIAQYQSAIALYQTLQTPYPASASIDLQSILSQQARTLNNLGMVHLKQGDQVAAQGAFEQGMALLATGDNALERGILVNSLGELYAAKGDRDQAWQLYLQAFQVAEQEADEIGEIEALLNFGRLMEAQAQPNLAIFFYKQAIARIETIRENLQPLSQSVQQRYTQTVEDFYRKLADLLLQQNREPEALQVLEMLKLQEVRSYLHNGSLGGDSESSDSDSERVRGREEALNTPAEMALLESFYALPSETSLADFLASEQATDVIDPAVNPAAAADPAGSADSNRVDNLPLNLQTVELLKAALAMQPVKTAVLYPLILSDRLEILLLTPQGSVEHFTTSVSQAELSKMVAAFQMSLKSTAFDPKPAAQQLYSWLIEPLEDTLAAQQIENIIYLPDGVLRYVPLAAFHDGDQWLVEKYQSHNITAATVDDLVKQNSSSLSVVAGAFTDSSLSYQVPVGSAVIEYSGLSAAQQEIDNLTQTIPNTIALLNRDFTSARMLSAVGDHRIVHLATHAKFVSGQPEDSFILFGNGETVNMQQLQSWDLPNVDLVVLSACETASSAEGDGKEILGLGFQMQQTGAGAAIASLWSVDDSATAALMSQFYLALSEGKTKAQALRQAQMRLIESERFSAPYDWGAFILIGNGL